MKLNISIIGSGIGGLAAAIRLAVRGHDVCVYEQSDSGGGMIQQKEWKGYRWDMGPSNLIMSDQAEELFLLAGEEMKVSVRSIHMDQVSRYFYADGMVLNAYGDVDEFSNEVQLKTGEPAKRVHAYLNRQRRRYELSSKVLLRYSYSLKEAILTGGLIRAYLLVLQNEIFNTSHGMNKRAFRSKHLIQLFDWLSSGQGSNPYKSPSTSNLNAHFIHNLGVYYPEKGMYILAKELQQLAVQLGVTFKFGEKVDAIELKNRTVKGIQTSEGFVKSDIVISNADIHYVYNDLLPNNYQPKKYLKQKLTNSVIQFFWAIDKEFSGLCVQNVLLSTDPKNEYDSLMNGKLVNDPTIQLHISSKIADNDAPEGCENWVIRVDVPANKGQDWNAVVASVRKEVIARINKTLNTDIEQHIIKEFITDPRSIEKDYASYGGSLFGSSNNRRLSAFRRHPNFLNQVHGLYFVGRTVHPGGGVPMGFSSARNIDHYIDRHYTLGN